MSAIPEQSQSILDDTVVEVGLPEKKNEDSIMKQAQRTSLNTDINIDLKLISAQPTPKREKLVTKPESKPVPINISFTPSNASNNSSSLII